MLQKSGLVCKDNSLLFFRIFGVVCQIFVDFGVWHVALDVRHIQWSIVSEEIPILVRRHEHVFHISRQANLKNLREEKVDRSHSLLPNWIETKLNSRLLGGTRCANSQRIQDEADFV